MTTELRVAMIGHGFMGAAHSTGWRQAPAAFDLPSVPRTAVLVGRDAQTTAASALSWGWAETSTDWRAVIHRDDIDVVDIVTPGDSHAEIAIAALAAGKHVLCEKPLANSVREAEAMHQAARDAAAHGIRAMVGFTYRRVPAVTLLRDMIAAGRIGTVRQVRTSYRQDWLSDPESPMTWRLDKDRAGSGALGDIGAHIVDMAQFVTGQALTQVSAALQTIVPERPVLAEAIGLGGTAGGERGKVTVDDLALFHGRFDSGVLASFEATRFATGRKNALDIEISGDAGALHWNLEDLNALEFYDATRPPLEQGFTRILVTEPEHPYLEGWWPAGHMLGYEHGFSHQAKDFIEAIANGHDPHPTFAEGLHVQRVLDAVERSASARAVWTEV
ncbi:putative dehydrogenase [Microbacterium sp. ZKA21]|uniref:Gfo/Idh/MocA family protein n=1 Tax=Microbacterium sp. ZKA21 TaxID=3381694 RepID=UPI003D1F1EFA